MSMIKTFQFRKNLIGWLAVALAIGVFPGIGFAQDADFAVKPINPVPAFDGGNIDYSKAMAQHFNYVGSIDAINDDSVVINDGTFKVIPNDQLKRLKPGTIVGLKVDGNGEIIDCQILEQPKSKSKSK